MTFAPDQAQENFKNSEYDQEIPQSQTADNPWHREEETLNHHETPGRQINKATSSLFPIKMIAMLEWTQSNTPKHRTLQTATMGVTINKKSTAIEPRLRTDNSLSHRGA